MRGLAIGALVVCLLCSTAGKSNARPSHQPKHGGLEQRIHHGATALLWIDRHRKLYRSLRELRRERAAHEWLLLDGLRRAGVLGPLLCIKRGEGAWTSNTGNGYYGGLQADLSFQAAYGSAYMRRWGTANNWPRWAQLHMGYRGWRARGYYPWPNTARRCGLI